MQSLPHPPPRDPAPHTRTIPREGPEGRLQRLFSAVAQGNIHVLQRFLELASADGVGHWRAIDVSREVSLVTPPFAAHLLSLHVVIVTSL